MVIRIKAITISHKLNLAINRSNILTFVNFSFNANLEHVPFQRLDFGETDILDEFYNADVIIVDMSITVQQSPLFYHIGVRQSMRMKHNIVLFYDTDPEQSLSLRVGLIISLSTHPPTHKHTLIHFFAWSS